MLLLPVFFPSKKQKGQKMLQSGYWIWEVWILSVLFVIEEALFWIYPLSRRNQFERCAHTPTFEKEALNLPEASRDKINFIRSNARAFSCFDSARPRDYWVFLWCPTSRSNGIEKTATSLKLDANWANSWITRIYFKWRSIHVLYYYPNS